MNVFIPLHLHYHIPKRLMEVIHEMLLVLFDYVLII